MSTRTVPVPLEEMSQFTNAAARVINARHRIVLTDRHGELREAIRLLDEKLSDLQRALVEAESERRAS